MDIGKAVEESFSPTFKTPDEIISDGIKLIVELLTQIDSRLVKIDNDLEPWRNISVPAFLKKKN